MQEPHSVLIVDDEDQLREVLRAYLEREGYAVTEAADAKTALAALERHQPNLVVLDLMLPDMPGEEVCRRIRERSDLPVLMLTARDSEESLVGGLAMGADDYVTKPFSPRELLARIRALIRRSRGATEPQVDVLRFDGGRLVIDPVRHAVSVDGKPVALTAMEFKLLLALARHPGRVYTRMELLDRVQGYDFEGYERTIDAHVKNLRQKIEPDSRHPRYVQTVFGVGYKFAPPTEPAEAGPR